MGNRAAAPQSMTDEEVGRDLQVLCDARLSQAQRRPAFERLRAHFAPVRSGGEDFAAELRRVFALRCEPWPAPPPGALPAERLSDLADRVRGCIYGAALGDAAGLAAEFLPRATVLEQYGEDFDFRPGCWVYADSHRMSFPEGDWTDDTDQLLLVLQTLLEAGGRADEQLFGRKLRHWREHGFPGLGDLGAAGLGQHTKAVLDHPDFEASPATAAKAIWEKGGRKAAANGAVMRTAVTGVPFFWDLAAVRENTEAFCSATHADPRCLASCIVVAESVSRLLQATAAGADLSVEDVLEGAIGSAESALPEGDDARAELRRHASARGLDELCLDEPRGIGYTLKCMGCGAWALRRAAELGFEGAIREVIMQGGDADTNACVAGALLGCQLGYRSLPGRWIDGMPYMAWLEAWVQKLLFMLQLPVTTAREQ